jgi:hypothetical protein
VRGRALPDDVAPALELEEPDDASCPEDGDGCEVPVLSGADEPGEDDGVWVEGSSSANGSLYCSSPAL